MRVASVLPSATEIVCALGHRSDLIARSAECDYPATVVDLPVVMRPRFLDADRPSREIDARVRATRGRGESLYELDVSLLRQLQPDLLLTQNLCGVCSVTEEEVAAACASAGVAPAVVSLSPVTLEDVWSSLEVVGRALNDPSAGSALAEAMRRRSRTRTRTGSRPRVAVVEWLDPPILAGLWVPAIVRAAGGTSVGAIAGQPGIRTTWESVRELRPDLMILSPCSFTVGRTQGELRTPSIATAVTRVAPPLGTYVADEAYFSRPGPRLADGVDLVRHLLRPGRWDPPMPIDRVPSPNGEVVA